MGPDISVAFHSPTQLEPFLFESFIFFAAQQQYCRIGCVRVWECVGDIIFDIMYRWLVHIISVLFMIAEKHLVLACQAIR